mmetsp:Transcript_10397/g.29602  ORF Transcript_10397/g.29602 Transcript_10397/m.29602 type:complete len:756 (+) Transcript_10397:156-2423(+)|eukprot:CAMPEP_0117660370 /NCGR_PEP_ID=MMETSP0804-20121206/6932_1 /TAXON_ID=1074897 /ORGANISM="Tetraselmis astigmatica, Strain CCMP880" /LENGTH=755 /DNA_ID=CAMNT_0005467095 /DNA_START=100 /DNA_END=2367 /DNA_ORIENTATION=+
MADFHELEEADGVRMTWNIWPSSKLEAAKCVIPFAAIVSPTKQLSNLMVVPYEPVPCKSCGAVLNPYARVDFGSKIWVCPFCHTRNHFPSHYAGIAEDNLPAELFPNYCTVEYTLQRSVAVHPNVYVFVIDTCVAEEELNACKASITQCLQIIPEEAHVGLVTFGTHVHVHELGCQAMARSYVFKGSKEYQPQEVQGALRLGPSSRQAGQQPQQQAQPPNRFILPFSECEFQLNSVLEELQVDSFPGVSEHRLSRCTGTALQVASALVTACVPRSVAQSRVMLFLGGAATEGPGKVVEKELSEAIRSHKDCAKDAAPLFKKAAQYYERVGSQLVAHGTVLDVFACALDQVGLAEMKTAVERTGGMVVQTDTFTNVVFKQSFKRLFASPDDEGFLGMSSNSTFEVIPSRDIKVAGLIGCASPMEKKSNHVSDIPVGMGGTTQWKMPSMDKTSSHCVLFDIVAESKDMPDPNNQQFFLQFITRYQHWDTSMRCRVTTITRRWTEGTALGDLVAGFDQEAAAVTMARLCSFKMETEDDFDATRWLDRTLIRLASRFGDYRKDDPSSFQLSPQLSYYPQFMFNLRRSQFVQVFNNSPDETAYFRLVLYRVPVGDGMVMIQPQITAYSFNGPPEPVLLDVSSLQPDRILLLDAYFSIVIHHGTTIAQWRKAEYHLQAEHQAFAQLLTAPREETESILAKRFPVPRLVDCDQGSGQARFLLAKLNPSATYNSSQSFGEVIMTDDVSLSVFYDHLKRLSVQS